VGGYPITLSGAADANYTITLVPGTLTVTPAALTITALNAARVYGAANPVFTVVYTGFVNGETPAVLDTPVVSATTAVSTSVAGTYPIMLSGASDLNYTITLIDGTLTVNPAATATSITSVAPGATTVVGQPITITFQVTPTPPGGGTPSGTVSVSLSGGGACSGSLSGGGGACVLTPTVAGPHTLSASYAGSANHLASASAGAAHTVNPAATTTTITAALPSTSVVGQSVMVTFTVAALAPGSGVPTGTVSVNAGAFSCSSSLSNGGGACPLTFTTAGLYTLTASYLGQANYLASASAGVAQTVNPAPTTVQITGDAPEPSVVGQAVTVNFSVTVNAPGAGTPTGVVTVTASSGAGTCSSSLVGGAGACAITFTAAGARTLTAAYSGNADFAGSASAGVPHVVNRADTAVTITGRSPTSTTLGQVVAVSYTVAVLSPGAGLPTGAVTVTAGADACTGTVAAGACALTFTSTGTKTLLATYGGDSNFNGDVSPGTTITVTRPTLQFSAPSFVGSEGATVPVTVTLSNPSVFTVTVNYSTTAAGSTATTPADYVATSGVLTFPPGNRAQAFTVQLKSDSLVDRDETIRLTLSGPNSNAQLGSPSQVNLIILDTNGEPSVGFDPTAVAVAEGTGVANLTLFMFPASATTVTVDIVSSNGTASGFTDYAPLSRTLAIPPGAIVLPVTVPITGEALFESDEVFTITLRNPVGAVLAAQTDQVAVTILNDDPEPAVSLTGLPYSVNEASSAGRAVFTATLSNPSAFPASIDYATANGTALLTSDYRASAGTLTFGAGVTTMTGTVIITDDATYEGNETFSLSLSNPGGQLTLGSPGSAVITITENDPLPVLRFSSAGYSVLENASAVTVTVVLSGSTALTTTVNYATSDGTARSGSDYTQSQNTLTFPPASVPISRTFSVPIVTANSAYEGDEWLALTLSAPAHAALGSPNLATLFIQEDDPPPTLQFSSASASLVEANTGYSVNVTLSGLTEVTATVSYATGGGTAAAGSDYQPASGTLTFPPLTTSRPISVTLLDDSLYEVDEAFKLTLASPVSATLGAPGAFTVTILAQDPLPKVQLNAPTYAVGESGGPLTLTATLDRASALTGQVTVTLAGGTAASGQDYVAGPVPLSFAPGVTSRTFSVSILPDNVAEGYETLNVTLTGASGLQLGPTAAAQVTIADDDPRAGCLIVNSVDLPKSIPDNTPGGVESLLVIPGPGMVISDVNVRLDSLRHTYTGDLGLYLLAPDGQSLTLIADKGVGTQGDGDDFLFTVLDDSAPLGFTSNPAPPFTGAFTPYNALAILNSRASAGTWKLKVVDTEAGDTGVLQAWGLEVCGTLIPDTGGSSFTLFLPIVRR
jgi:subtilisin-like proprotein convertase family protein